MMKKSMIFVLGAILGVLCVLWWRSNGMGEVRTIRAPKVEALGVSFKLNTSPVKAFLDEGYALYYDGQKVDTNEEVGELLDLGKFVLSNGEKEVEVNLINYKNQSVSLEQCTISAIYFDFEKNSDDFKIKKAVFSKGMNKAEVMVALENSGIKRGTEISEDTNFDLSAPETESSNEGANIDDLENMLESNGDSGNTDDIESMFEWEDAPESPSLVKYTVIKARYDFGVDTNAAYANIHINEETDEIVRIELVQIYTHDMTGAGD